MISHDYLIIGAGMTADAAARGIRELDPNGTIGVIGAESDAPYSRPPLTKALWKGDPFDSVWRKTSDVAGVTLYPGVTVKAVDTVKRIAVDDAGTEYGFGKVLFATGSTPRRLPFGGDRVNYFRTLNDYRMVRSVADRGGSFVVIGGGFIGSEIAAALAMNGRTVTMLFPETGIGARIFPADLAAHLVDYYRGKDVDVRTGQSVTNIEHSGDKATVTTKDGTLTADLVIAGVGVAPNTDVAREAGIAVDDGIVVDERLRAGSDQAFAAGDVARFMSPSLGKRIRVEHEDNALTMGKAAGRSMAGDTTPYTHLPFFYSDLFDLGYEAVGDTDSRLQTVADWKTPFQEGVVYYVDAGRVRGVLLWGIFGKVDAARELIAQSGPFTAQDLKGKI